MPGRVQGARPLLLLLDQTEALETARQYLRVWMTYPPPLSEGLEPHCFTNYYEKGFAIGIFALSFETQIRPNVIFVSSLTFKRPPFLYSVNLMPSFP